MKPLSSESFADIQEEGTYTKRQKYKDPRKPHETRVCVWCGKEFDVAVTRKKITCGSDCSADYHDEQSRARARAKTKAKKVKAQKK